jgi:hypothetical protein
VIDDNGNFDFSQDPEKAYEVPPDHMFTWGIRIWRTFDSDGEPKVYWHVDGSSKAVEAAGTLELVKAALIDQQIRMWRDDDEAGEGEADW